MPKLLHTAHQCFITPFYSLNNWFYLIIALLHWLPWTSLFCLKPFHLYFCSILHKGRTTFESASLIVTYISAFTTLLGTLNLNCTGLDHIMWLYLPKWLGAYQVIFLFSEWLQIQMNECLLGCFYFYMFGKWVIIQDFN